MLRGLYASSALLFLSAMATAQCVSSFPATEPFTSGTVGTPGTLPTNWVNLSGDDLNWFVDNNGTNGNTLLATGPYTDRTFNNTTANGKYMYVESSGAGNTPNRTAILESPCYPISTLALANPYLTFWYHMRGSQMGSLIIDVNDNGTVTQNLWSASGNQGLYWKQGSLDLSPWAGSTNLRIRFRAITGSGELSDIAIDDVVVRSLVPVFGCNETTATNYSASVNVNNGTCDYSCPSGQSRVRIDIFHDGFPGETTWTLKNGSTNATIASGTTSTTVCVPTNTCLVFRINDSFGDGIWHNSNGYGQYFVWLGSTLVKQGGQFGSFEETIFNCPPGFSCSSAIPLTLAPLTGTYPQTLATITTTALEQWYNFTPPQSGQYQITTCNSNTCDTRLWIYDMACASIVLSDGVEGATFADDDDGGCGTQAVINGNMPGNVLHRLRVGHNASGNACGSSVTVSIIFMGPVTGCMNPQSCNYEPLATVPCVDCCLSWGNPLCTMGPDLIISQSALQSSLNLATVNIANNCALEEGCVRGMGQRYVIRFATRIENIGTADYYIGKASPASPMFNYTNCHGHAHFEGYADYILFDQDNNAIPVGFKNGFCVMDVGCYPGNTAQYNCTTMGITKGCYDIYGSGTTCNWIDITDVPNGQYTLVLRTNWQQAADSLGRHELSYANNFAQVCINITRNAQNVPSFTVVTPCPTWTDCLGQAYGDARLDCTGACAGNVKMGDLTNDGLQTVPDAQAYVAGILGNDLSPTACNDLNADTAITVTDAALMVHAYSEQSTHNALNHVLHYHPWFDFPRGWFSSGDQVDLSIGNLDPIAKTVDILIRNPTCRVLGYEFEMSGITIQSVQNLAPNLMGDIAVQSTLGGNKVIGLSYIDSSLVKNTDFVPLLRIQYLTLTDASICISNITDVVNDLANNVPTTIVDGCLVVPNAVTVSPKVMLEGAYEEATGMMRDSLRVAGIIPLVEPYTSLGFQHTGGGGGEIRPGLVSEITGPNAIVDWVLVELRATTPPHAVVSTRSALVQRDGDVVGTDGQSPVVMFAPSGNYRVAIRHRNHLGAMTASSVALGTMSTVVDFGSSSLSTYGTEARKDVNGTMLLWTGNATPNAMLSYLGTQNDRDAILTVIGGAAIANIIHGYYLEDTNLDGWVKYVGTTNDRDPILVNIGGINPTNVRFQQLP